MNSEITVETLNGEVEIYETFDEMNLPSNLLRGIFAYGFEKPSAIQKRAIIPFVKKMDMIAQAQSGTGKTATFGIGVLANIDPKLQAIQAIIVSPTRELSTQSFEVISRLADYLDIRIVECIGGKRVDENIRELKTNPHLILGTPGRINDLIQKGVLSTDKIISFVLDEADEMLSRGFSDQIYDIFVTLPKTAQVGLFSATLPPEALEITKKFMSNPIQILVKTEEITLDGIKQFYINTEREDWKLDTLCDLYEQLNLYQTVIFCNTKRKVMWLADHLSQRDFSVSIIHGDLTTQEREVVMREFRTGSTRILICTDLLARGIDVPSVSMVLNYDLPRSESGLENYIHRIGRCGRFGKKGVAINFVNADEKSVLVKLENFYHTAILEMPNDISNLL